MDVLNPWNNVTFAGWSHEVAVDYDIARVINHKTAEIDDLCPIQSNAN